jgi:hypothetical protein
MKGPLMTDKPSDLVRAMVLRELEQGVRHDALWLQALSQAKLDPVQARRAYIAMRCQALQSDVKGLLVKQIRGAIASDGSSLKVQTVHTLYCAPIAAVSHRLGGP